MDRAAGSAGGARPNRAEGKSLVIRIRAVPESTSIDSGGTVFGVHKGMKCVFFSAGELQATVANQRGFVFRVVGPLDLPITALMPDAGDLNGVFILLDHLDRPARSSLSSSFCNSNLGLPLATISPPSNWTSSASLGSRSSLPRETASLATLARLRQVDRRHEAVERDGLGRFDRLGGRFRLFLGRRRLDLGFGGGVPLRFRFRRNVGLAGGREGVGSTDLDGSIFNGGSGGMFRGFGKLGFSREGIFTEQILGCVRLFLGGLAGWRARFLVNRTLLTSVEIWLSRRLRRRVGILHQKGQRCESCRQQQRYTGNGPPDSTLRCVEPGEYRPAEGRQSTQGCGHSATGLDLPDGLFAGLGQLGCRCRQDRSFCAIGACA